MVFLGTAILFVQKKWNNFCSNLLGIEMNCKLFGTFAARVKDWSGIPRTGSGI